MKKTLHTYFKKRDIYSFVLLFGSFAKGAAHLNSDVDIGVWFKNDIDLIELGYDQAKLESLLQKPIQLVALNDIYKKDPLFAFEVLAAHQPILIEDEKKYLEFKRYSQLYYLDHVPLIEANRKHLKKRIEKGMIGERNHA